ncbi:MAG: DUF2752 domain-containing protein [Phycisphaeraceae bacterium]|nr:MAG: DUF2752 domain-containing protein [Phycisphaeraceae bacterium]
MQQPPDSASAPAPLRACALDRAIAAAVALGCLAVLTAAAWAEPSPDGHGTHRQFGLPPCNWVAAFDFPCFTCGMTTSFAHAADGDLPGSFLTQPMGAVLALLTASAFWIALHVAATGSRLGRLAGALIHPAVLTLAGLGLLAAWGYKVMTWGG